MTDVQRLGSRAIACPHCLGTVQIEVAWKVTVTLEFFDGSPIGVVLGECETLEPCSLRCGACGYWTDDLGPHDSVTQAASEAATKMGYGHRRILWDANA